MLCHLRRKSKKKKKQDVKAESPTIWPVQQIVSFVRSLAVSVNRFQGCNYRAWRGIAQASDVYAFKLRGDKTIICTPLCNVQYVNNCIYFMVWCVICKLLHVSHYVKELRWYVCITFMYIDPRLAAADAPNNEVSKLNWTCHIQRVQWMRSVVSKFEFSSLFQKIIQFCNSTRCLTSRLHGDRRRFPASLGYLEALYVHFQGLVYCETLRKVVSFAWMINCLLALLSSLRNGVWRYLFLFL